ncbi:MAG: S9 family peptidase [Gemmatimonadales bacterium]|nr:MAG: S9 family peptidase [Gemmatimonadales bacterium]
MTRLRLPRFRCPAALGGLSPAALLAPALALALVLPSGPASAHSAPSTLGAHAAPVLAAPATASDTIPASRYQMAERFLTQNASSRVYRADVNPTWDGDDRFWYRTRVPGGFQFVRVNADRNEQRPAFDHERLSSALSAATGESYEALRLPFTSFTEVDDGAAIRVGAAGSTWRCSLSDYRCEEAQAQPSRPGVTSPDGRYTAFRRGGDLWVFDGESGQEIRLTDDAEERYTYAADSQGWRQSNQPILLWSPDSRSIATYQLDERGVEEMHLLRTAEPRPQLQSWPYALPSDSIVPMLERVVIHLEGEAGGPEVVRLDTPPDHQRTSSCCGLARGQQWADVEWSEDGDQLAFVSVSRDYRTATLRLADARTGSVRTVMEESHPKFFESHIQSGGLPNWRVLHDRGQVLWYSQRSGWGHLYLYDLETGEPIRQVTGGDWNVLDVVDVDEGAGQLLITALGREADENPYYTHMYRVSLGAGTTGGSPAGSGDGSLERLTEPGTDHALSLSPSGRFFVDRASTVYSPPVSVLRRTSDGAQVLVLEEADISELTSLGWRPPEPFTVRARDGVTEVHGLMVLPSDFDANKSYPIVNAIYPGPQTGSVGTRGFSVSRRGQAHALAELGFVVVLVDALGSPLRSKRFHTYYYGDMADNGLPDQKAAMQELAQRHDFIDLDRVGIYGHSGGGFATVAALLRHPDFFHVGVGSAGNLDNRGYTYYWGEKYHGPFEVDEDGRDSFEVQAMHLMAEELEGKLLLSYGTMDSNVHPNTTLLLVDALISANKDFDLIVMPNRGHGYANEAYHVRRTWDYFVTHLMGKTPPREYRIGG